MKTRIKVAGIVLLTLLFIMAISTVSTLAQNRPQTLAGITERVSIASDGVEGNAAILGVSISANGRYVAFSSSASNLVYGDDNYYCDLDYDGIYDDNCYDIFVHDRVTGDTTLVSIATDGTKGNMFSQDPLISADGRYVVFVSESSNLVTGDTNGFVDYFVHDLATGETTRVSVASNGTQGNAHSYGYSSISEDGRYVAFGSYASNLVVGDTNMCDTYHSSYNCYDVFVHDRVTGETARVSVASDGTQSNGDSGLWGLSISADGRYVAFPSRATNLVLGDTNNNWDIFIHDRVNGETTRVSVASDGTQGDQDSDSPSISMDGRYVAFESSSTNLVMGDTNEFPDSFVHDWVTGETTRVSVASDGTQGNGSSGSSVISSDGRYVAFYSLATNLVLGDTNNYCDNDYDGIYNDNCPDVFVHDRMTGETTRVSVASDGIQGDSASSHPAFSADGRYVAFESLATNLVLGDTNNYCDNDYDGIYNDNCPDVFVHDREGLAISYSVSGHIIDSDGNPLPGVNISAGYGYSTISDNQGDYTILGLQSGTYWITPSLDGYYFAPIRRMVSVPPDRVGINFTQGFPAFLPMISR